MVSNRNQITNPNPVGQFQVSEVEALGISKTPKCSKQLKGQYESNFFKHALRDCIYLPPLSLVGSITNNALNLKLEVTSKVFNSGPDPGFQARRSSESPLGGREL